MSRPERLHNLNGELLTARQISARTGLSVKTIWNRIMAGDSELEPKPRGRPRRPRPLASTKPDGRRRHLPPARRYEHEGESLTAVEWAERFGCAPQAIRQRAQRGAPLDGSTVHKAKTPYGSAGYDTFAVGMSSVFDDAQSYEADTSVRRVRSYYAMGRLLMSDDEIRAQFADLGRLSDEGVAWAREQAEALLFRTGWSTDLSLETIGDFEGVCRERVRQVETDAARQLRNRLRAMGLEQDLRDELRERDTRRRLTWAEVVDQFAMGDS